MNIVAIVLLTSMIVVSTCITKKFPESISEMAYVFPKWIFTLLMVIIAFIICPSLMTVVGLKYEWLGMLVILGLLCVAFSPYYKTEGIGLHYLGAILCFISAIGIVCLFEPLYLFAWVLFPLSLFNKTRKWWLMIAECICFLEIMLMI